MGHLVSHVSQGYRPYYGLLVAKVNKVECIGEDTAVSLVRHEWGALGTAYSAE